ncbi:MAG: hypothetical protein CM1200mP30_13760 [Pseudomonadota bacterium]|nr:MAG: hypothetical protein CM1200mP30_13760 [Pseudomonadota bacterium]
MVGSFGKHGKQIFYLLEQVVTSLPLLWFVNAAKRLRYTTMGFFQYFHHPFNRVLGIFFK